MSILLFYAPCKSADHASQRRIEAETLSIIDTLVASQPTVDRLAKESQEGVLGVSTASATMLFATFRRSCAEAPTTEMAALKDRLGRSRSDDNRLDRLLADACH